MPNSLFPAADAVLRKKLERDETLRLFNSFDWGATPLGPFSTWPEALKGAVRVMTTSPVPTVILAGRQGILIYNDAYARFAGGRHPSIYGQPAEEAWPEIADFNRHKIEIGLAGETLCLVDQELVLDRHGRPEPAWLNLNYSPILGEDGVPLAVLVIVLETTERVLAQQALARSEERLSMALNGSALVGTWDWDLASNIVTADDRLANLSGVDPLRAAQGVGIDEFLAPIHPADRKRVETELAAATQKDAEYRSEYRLGSEGGPVRWVVASGRPRLDAAGKPIRFPGIVVDITEQKAVGEALADSELRFRTLADAMPQMVWSSQPDGAHDYFNARWYEFTGAADGSTDGQAWNDILHPDDREAALSVWRHSLASGELYETEYRLRHHSGQFRWVLGRALPARDETGAIIRWFGTCTDIHEAKLAAEEREVVAQELSHRIKNIFAVLMAITSMSARSYPQIKPFADQLRERIQALGKAHDFVRPHAAEAGMGQHSLQALIRTLLSPYETAAEPRIVLVGPDANIDDGAATPLALLFHELATNSAKYGALATAGGLVTLKAAVRDGTYFLEWKETGGKPPAEADRPSGFGSRLISLSVEGQLRGRLAHHWEPDGLRVEVEVPLSSLNRSSSLIS